MRKELDELKADCKRIRQVSPNAAPVLIEHILQRIIALLDQALPVDRSDDI